MAYLTNEVVVVVDDRLRVQYVSPSIRQVLGYTPAEYVGLHVPDLLHPDDAATFELDTVVERLTPGDDVRFTSRVRHRDGDWRWMDIAALNRLDDPEVGGLVSTLRDITDRVEAEEALRASRERLVALVANSTDVLIVTDAAGRVTFASPAIARSIGVGPDDVVGIDLASFVHPAEAERATEVFDSVRDEPGGAGTFEVRVLRADARYILVEVHVQNLLHDPKVEGMVVHGRDITGRRQAEQEAARFQSIIESTPDVVVITDADGRILYLNPAARRIAGVDDDADLAGLDPAALFAPASLDRVLAEALPAISDGGIWSGDLELANQGDGRTIAVSHVLLAQAAASGGVAFYASVSRDMTANRRLEAALKHQADHDDLTGLPNRVPLIERLSEALAEAGRQGRYVGVLFLDLDRFKVVNDSLGHHTGDALIVAVGRRLVRAIRPGDCAGRFGGDEFVVICPAMRDAEDLVGVAERIRRDVGGSFHLDGEETFVSVSIGAALGSPFADPSSLLRDADAAMYAAKAAGRDRIRLFDAPMRLQVVERLEVERELRRALERHELLLHFQPVVSLPSGQIRGVEALVRWYHPRRGLLMPDQFLAVAEETGLIVDLGEWVLQRACEEARTWGSDRATGRPIPVYVNLSARQLVDANLVGRVTEVIDLTGVAPAAVHFEITEHALMADAVTTRSTLQELRRLGIKLALDDFGTGYSSLAHLKHFPVDALKIDRSFVEGLGTDHGDAAITAAIVDVAQRLGLETVAEGVESLDQAEWLTALGCDLAQGYHYARPMGAAELRGHLPA
jgi:diguanylate cyclase (GGDEF)-like protein/PAS domain S-box-containing protein